MFCPQCGQQQLSDEIRFCPRCGLSLWPHAALLAAGNTAADGPGGAQVAVKKAKRAGTRRGAKLMFFGLALFPVFLAFSIAADAGEPLLIPFLLFMAGLVWWAYARLFGEELTHATHQASPGGLKAGGENPALNDPQFVPAFLFHQQRANTAEIYQPPSVTENTTKLLNKDT